MWKKKELEPPVYADGVSVEAISSGYKSEEASVVRGVSMSLSAAVRRVVYPRESYTGPSSASAVERLAAAGAGEVKKR